MAFTTKHDLVMVFLVEIGGITAKIENLLTADTPGTRLWERNVQRWVIKRDGKYVSKNSNIIDIFNKIEEFGVWPIDSFRGEGDSECYISLDINNFFESNYSPFSIDASQSCLLSTAKKFQGVYGHPRETILFSLIFSQAVPGIKYSYNLPRISMFKLLVEILDPIYGWVMLKEDFDYNIFDNGIAVDPITYSSSIRIFGKSNHLYEVFLDRAVNDTEEFYEVDLIGDNSSLWICDGSGIGNEFPYLQTYYQGDDMHSRHPSTLMRFEDRRIKEWWREKNEKHNRIVNQIIAGVVPNQ